MTASRSDLARKAVHIAARLGVRPAPTPSAAGALATVSSAAVAWSTYQEQAASPSFAQVLRDGIAARSDWRP